MPPDPIAQSNSPIEREVVGIRRMISGRQYGAALDAAQRLLAEVPENRDVLYLIAVSQRYLQRIPEALATLAHFETLHPTYSRLFQERGHCCVAAGDPGAALQAYRHAVALNPALPASWRALHLLFRSANQMSEAENAAGHAARLGKLPSPIVTARSMLADNELIEADRIVRRFLGEHPNDVEGMRLLAQIGMKLDVLDDAEFLLESVLVFAPDYHDARHDYVSVLLRRHQHAKALAEASTLLAIDPANKNFRALRAGALVGLGRHEEALAAFQELCVEMPEAADLHLSIAHAAKTLGRQQDAIEAYRRAAATRSGYGDAYWSLANLKTYRFTDAEMGAMREAEADPSTAAVDRYHLCFALGKAFEDAGDYAASFRFYERGNALKRSDIRFEISSIERNARLQRTVCTRELFASRHGVGCSRNDPIFIVGLPRAGSTLIEQILASHSHIEGTMELADVPRLVQLLQGRDAKDCEPRYPAVLAQLTPAELLRFGEKYLQDTRIYRTGKPFFIDKMPNNFRHIGLIHLILPNARIIDARREPMACCFSNFKQLFAAGQEFTYSIEDIARYYCSYVDLMSHWDEVLPGRILRIQHEDLVNDLEGNVRRMLAFCGLEFEVECLEFFKTERSVRTASSEQVRRPIYTEGLDQWRHFEPWLAPLKAALAPVLEDA
jgi:tetratricopeptide (TPR) repeat protein